MKKAILMISSGTTVVAALDATTNKLEKKLKEKYPEHEVYQAFSVGPIVKKMKELNPDLYFGVEEMLQNLVEKGIEDLTVLSFNMIKGTENEKTKELLNTYKDKFAKFAVSKPLFHVKEDYIKALDGILSAVELGEDEALMLVGHGTEHHDNTEYQNLEYTAYTQGKRNIFVATLTGYQKTFLLMRKLQLTGCKKVRLMPLLLVAGKHARVDIAGDGDSWKTKLLKEGYEVEVEMTGVGELEAIQDLFMEHLDAVME